MSPPGPRSARKGWQLSRWLPLRRDTFGLACFGTSALAFFLLHLGPPAPWRPRTRRSGAIDAGLRTLVCYPLLVWVYLGVNSLTHPRTIDQPLTHFTGFPTESTTAVLCFVVSAAALLALRVRRGTGHG